MRLNKYGITRLKGVNLDGGVVYFWQPPLALQRRRIFGQTTLGMDFGKALAKACSLNVQLHAYRGGASTTKRRLNAITTGTVAHFFGEFERSPRFGRYAPRTRIDYSCIYRDLEVHSISDLHTFGEVQLSKVTRQLAYSMYERCVFLHGHDSTNKAMTACRAAFKYAVLKTGEVLVNPFSQLDTFNPPPRRRQWTEQQLTLFVRKAEEMGFSSIGRCALLCVDLVQRPGDILDLKWGAFDFRDRVWLIRQTKRGTVVRVPETERLLAILDGARRLAKILW